MFRTPLSYRAKPAADRFLRKIRMDAFCVGPGGGRISMACLAAVRYADTLNRFISNVFQAYRTKWRLKNAVSLMLQGFKRGQRL